MKKVVALQKEILAGLLQGLDDADKSHRHELSHTMPLELGGVSEGQKDYKSSHGI